MAETKLRDRAFALSLAILFAFTALATSVAVILSIVSSNKDAKKAASTTSTSTSQSQKCTTNCLAGKPLAGFTPVASVPALQVTDLKVGTGATATANSTVSVQYTGAIASTGIVFQSSLDQGPAPISFPLSGVIPGFKEGITGMKVGGTRQILIPAAMGYGSTAQQGIPANSNLVFNVTLLGVK